MSSNAAAIVTPEAVALDLEPVGVVERTLAKILDLLVQVIVWLALFGLGWVALYSSGLRGAAIAWWTTTGFLSVVGYPVAVESATRGRTVGKYALGLRTVTVEGLPIRFRHAAVRGVMELVDLWLSAGSVGMSAIVWSRRHQRVGDMVAGTMVLRQRGRAPMAAGPPYRAGTRIAPGAHFVVPPGMEEVASSLDVSALGTETYRILRSYLLRFKELEPAARQQLGLTLADRVAGEVGFTPRPSVTPDLFLATVAACHQARFTRVPTADSAWPPWPPQPPTGAPAGQAASSQDEAGDESGVDSGRSPPGGAEESGFTPIQ